MGRGETGREEGWGLKGQLTGGGGGARKEEGLGLKGEVNGGRGRGG